MKISGAQILVETLIEQGTDVVFGYPGGAVLDLYDALYKASDRIRHIISAHEQGAAHAADGYARVSGKVGVVIATSGPGATNLVTGIANAHLDSIPMVAITGNVSHAMIGRDSFQEVDIVGITLPVTKHNFQVESVEKLADTVREAFRIAKSGRPGPVLIDIPKDVQVGLCEYEPKSPVAPEKSVYAYENDIDRAVRMIEESERPYIYCGGGVLTADAGEEILALADTIDAPIGMTMMGLSSIPESCGRLLGMSGMHGHYTSTKAMYEADLILALGVRFSDRATGNKKKFANGAKIIHIDVDPAEIDKNIPAHLGISANLKDTVARILEKTFPKTHPEWQKKIAEWKEYEYRNSYIAVGKLHPYLIIDKVMEHTQADTPIATDVGQHQMWVAQHYRFEGKRTLITSGGLGTMGFGMGGAIGSAVASGKRTVLFTGDGSFGMNLNEMATAVSEKLPIVIVLFNNGVLGMVRQWQNLFYGKRFSQTTLDRKTDFVKLAEAFGAKGLSADDEDSLKAALNEAFSTDGPVLIDCKVDKDEMVFPMIPAGGTITDLLVNLKN
ncbi:MAG: biosynthetic-type acetolactate synthase large subunit [Eubacteriales bacterium]